MREGKFLAREKKTHKMTRWNAANRMGERVRRPQNTEGNRIHQDERHPHQAV